MMTGQGEAAEMRDQSKKRADTGTETVTEKGVLGGTAMTPGTATDGPGGTTMRTESEREGGVDTTAKGPKGVHITGDEGTMMIMTGGREGGAEAGRHGVVKINSKC